MSHMERYLDRIIDSNATPEKEATAEVLAPAMPSYDVPVSEEEHASPNILKGLLRRWYVILLVFIGLTVIGVPAVILLYEPAYVVTALIHVAPAVVDPLTGEAERGNIANYESFMRTQAMTITSTPVLNKVADELAERNLAYFNTNPKSIFERLTQKFIDLDKPKDALDVLKKAVRVGAISVTPRRGTEYIVITMKSMLPAESRIIVDSMVRNYMADYAFGTTQAEEKNLTTLEDQARVLKQKVERGQSEIKQLAFEFGSKSLDTRQDMMVESISEFRKQLAALESQRINLEISLELLKQGIDVNEVAEDQLIRRNMYIKEDTRIAQLQEEVSTMERDVFMSERTLTPENPVMIEKKALLERLRLELDDKRQEVGEEFDQMVAQESAQRKKIQLEAAQTSLNEVLAHQARLQEIIGVQDTDTKQLGRTNLEIQDLEFQLGMDLEMYESIRRRINQLELERNRLPRMTTPGGADNEGIEDKRIQLCIAVIFGALAAGCGLAFLLDKADKRVRDPEELSKHLHMPILGTVASSTGAKAAKFAEQVAIDYQAIRTNLGLMGLEGVPRKLAIVSATTQEGKTTFSINLATSLARSGKRVLLVDGDLRKPSIVSVMDIGDLSRRSHKVVTEGGFEYTVYTVPSSGVDVLIPDVRKLNDVYELIASPMVSQRIEMMSQKYDHVIIDTPPVLAFPDAIIWGRVAGNAIMVSFAGRSLGPDLATAMQRLAQARVRVLGTVMNNVQSEQSYHRYGYGYYTTRSKRGSRGRKLMLPSDDGADSQAGDERPVVSQS